MAPFKAWIIPIDESPGVPTHPIAPGGGAPVDPGYGYPGYRPSHPIAPGGGAPVDPGYGYPGYRPEHPIVIPPDIPGIWPPGKPAHPIVLPPEPPAQVWPDPPGKPPGGQTGSPSQPIELPPSAVASTHGFWALTFFPEMGGWLWAWVPVEVAKPAAKK